MTEAREGPEEMAKLDEEARRPTGEAAEPDAEIAMSPEEAAQSAEEAPRPAGEAAETEAGPSGEAARAAGEEGGQALPGEAPLPRLNGLDLEMKETMVNTTTGTVVFDVPTRYELLTLCGSGEMGTVCQAEDWETNERVAVKKLPHVFEHRPFTLRTLRDIRTLRHLKHENILRLREVFFSDGKATSSAIYVVTDYMEMDLAQVIRSAQPLTDFHMQVFSYQILRGLKYMHSAHVIHRDLKPRNILVNANCDLKICDLSLVVVSFESGGQVRHQATKGRFSCTRWYCAPELLCASTASDSAAVDIWSLGCIFAEMHTTLVAFRGTSTCDQLHLIIALLGCPTEDEVRMIESERCRLWICSLPKVDPVPVGKAFASMTEPAQGFLMQMLRWGAQGRASAAQLLRAPYLEWLHMPDDEPIREPLDIAEYEFERRKVTPLVLREELFREMLHYYPDLRRRACEDGPQADISQCELLLPGQGDDDDPGQVFV